VSAYRSSIVSLVLSIGAVLGSPVVSRLDAIPDADLDALRFEREVAPLLAARCLECHSGPKPEGKLDLTNRAGALKGGANGSAIAADAPLKSRLWQRVLKGEMPPKSPLSSAEKEILKRWLSSGAAWGSEPIDRFSYTTQSRAGYDWWALQPISRPSLPAVIHPEQARNAIDRFLLAKLETSGLSFSAAASPRALLRRLYIDLTGLPPTPEEVAAFERDPSDKAYAREVDRLLASPRYGERWGRHWLDIARYGESDGFERNKPRRHSWHYRDWVIAAFNDDMPYDQFARLQLAGDTSPDLARPYDGLAPLGFLVAGVHNTVVGGSQRMKKLAREDELEEIVGAVGQTFLGLTVNCARCHDHKFDPIRQSEYYQLTAALAGIRHGVRDFLRDDLTQQAKVVTARLAQLNDQLASLEGPALKAVRAARGNTVVVPEPPAAVSQWDFETDLRDSLGNLHGTSHGAARLEGGALVLDGKTAYVTTTPLTQDLKAKTIEAVVQLDSLEQRGGAAISLQRLDGGRFDAIVFGEQQPRRWMAGSDGFSRTRSFDGPDETAAVNRAVHMVIVYAADGTVTGYRDGEAYGKPYKTNGPHSFRKGKDQVVFGLRHSAATASRLLTGRIHSARLYDRALSETEVRQAAASASDYVLEDELLAHLSVGERNRRAKLREEREALRDAHAKLMGDAEGKIYSVLSRQPAVRHTLIRGDIDEPGDVALPGAVAAVRGVSAVFDVAADRPEGERRRKLAEWVTAPKNPLFARVLVNRLWHYHFGTGIVETPSDLGFNGGRPSHPELLDWMAADFATEGFRMKPLQRRIVLSTAYRQASPERADAQQHDATNRLLWRWQPKRLQAEALRDSMLHIAGALNLQIGGPGFIDVTINPHEGTTYYSPFDREDAALNRRTVYRFSPRGGRSALLDAFDCPDPSGAAPRRTVTTTPLQALSLLNNAFALRMSDRLAARISAEGHTSPAGSIARAYALCYQRLPEPDETQLAREFVSAHGLPALCRALFNSNEFLFVD
jgi:hypothetical protein